MLILDLHTNVDTHTCSYLIMCTYTHTNTCSYTHMMHAFKDKEKSVQITNPIEVFYPILLGM